MSILVFLHGTTIMHAAAGLPREERVRQVRKFEGVDHLPDESADLAGLGEPW